MIYFIQAGESGPIKIGFSNGRSAVKRLRHFQTGHYETLHLLGTMDGGRREEHSLHRRFSQFHIRGEWFTPAESLLIYVYRVTKGLAEVIVQTPTTSPKPQRNYREELKRKCRALRKQLLEES